MPAHSTPSGFTLVELLTVMAIFAILLTVAVRGGGSILQERRMDDAGRILQSELEYARQIAVTLNRRAELRLTKTARTQGDPETYHRIQVGVIEPDGRFLPKGKVALLPQGVMLSSAAALSPVITALESGNEVRLVIRPTGLLEPHPDLGMDDLWFFTAIRERDAEVAPAALPNFATVKIDPWTGRSQLYRP